MIIMIATSNCDLTLKETWKGFTIAPTLATIKDSLDEIKTT